MRRAALFLAAVSAACGAGDGATEARHPDVALILIDTLRRDHLDLYGYPRETAPWLRRLAEEGVVFERAHSTSSWTAPATATVLTGLYPPRHGVVMGHNAYGRGEDDEEDAVSLRSLPSALATLPELLQRAGYQTYGIAANVNVDPARGFARGFDRFERRRNDPGEKLADTLEEWAAERDPDRPAFWYVHFNDVHMPYVRRNRWYRSEPGVPEDEACYDSEIGYVDALLERLEASLGWGDEALVVALSDHGEEFRDHGSRGHRARLYAELVNVPLVVRAPGRGAGLRPTTMVSLIDVLPTVAELAGVPLDQERHGRSLVPLLAAGGSFPARTLYAHRRKPLVDEAVWAVVSGRWKLIVNDLLGTVELFDVEADPTEQDNLAERHPEVTSGLQARLEGFRALQPMAADTVEVELDAEFRAHLEAMGYGGDDDE